MPALKKKYRQRADVPAPAPVVQPTIVPFSMDLNRAVQHLGVSKNHLREAIYAKHLVPVNPDSKPYIFLRENLEQWVRDGARKGIR